MSTSDIYFMMLILKEGDSPLPDVICVKTVPAVGDTEDRGCPHQGYTAEQTLSRGPEACGRRTQRGGEQAGTRGNQPGGRHTQETIIIQYNISFSIFISITFLLHTSIFSLLTL